MTLQPRPCRSVFSAPSDQLSYQSVDPEADLRRLFAGSGSDAPEPSGFPMRSASGEWMIPIVVDLPYALLAGLEAAAQSQEIDDIVRSRWWRCHGTPGDIIGLRSDRFVTVEERREITGMTRL